MPGWVKVLLIIAILVVLLVAGVVGGGAFLWYRYRDTVVAKTKSITEESQQFGRHTDNQGCVDEALSRYRKDPGLSSAISSSLFMRFCLDASRPTKGFCDDVPKQLEFMKSVQWRMAKCQEVRMQSDSNCPQLFAPVQQFCEENKKEH